MTQALSFSIGGLVIARHNKIRDELFYISRRDFTSAYVCAKPLIHQGRTRSEQEICLGSDKYKDTRGDVIIQGLWGCQFDAIIDVKLGDADADMYKYEPMISLLARWENINKDNHSKHCNDQRKYFSPFVLLVDGMIGREALAVLSQMSQFMSEKREEPLLQLRGWVNRHITIYVAR